ncbi:MAG TPA: chemotaxis protein CheW [Kofleriaceae bacterium]|nr:chemotaxis protein CheW [Kofleriaceae bacterium]
MAATGRRVLATEDTFLAAYTDRRGRRQRDREVLTFQLGDEVYGLDIASLREISRLRPLTELPRVPSFLCGIIALRGVVVPILDLRRRMRMRPREASAAGDRASRILIVDHQGEPFGLIVDRVVRVERLDNAQIEGAPLPGGIASEYVAGVARAEGELIVLLELAAVVSFDLESP